MTQNTPPRKHWSGIAGCWCDHEHSIREAFDLNYPEVSDQLEAESTLAREAGREVAR